jgi:hypothetical protein
MTEQSSMPLIGPLKQRRWHDIVRFRPLSTIAHAALVVTRQGRFVGVIPADDRHVLSDYLTRPYDFREVDMRERLLPIALRLESSDIDYEFNAALKIVYQVERPERIATELEDALVELEQILVQSIRATSRAFGVEQTKALEQHLLEALLYSDVLRGRLSAVGLLLCRADIMLDLDEQARERADLLREHMRERPLTANLTIESLDAGKSFDALIGGSYRLISRGQVVAQECEAKLHDAVYRTLSRVGITFAAHDYEGAERAMFDALRFDSLLQAELATAEIEIVRATVKIQPNRDMVIAAQQALPVLPAPAPERVESREFASLGDRFEPSEQLDSVMPWGALGKMFGRDQSAPAEPQPLPALAANRALGMPEPSERSDESGAPFEPTFGPAPISSQIDTSTARPEESQTADDLVSGMPDALAQPIPEPDTASAPPSWSMLGRSFSQDTAASLFGGLPAAEEPLADMADEPAPAPLPEPAPTADIPAMPRPAPAPSSERIGRWIGLLKADDPALFKLWSLELQGRPGALPTILSALTDDPVVLQYADDAAHQRALVLALAQPPSTPESNQPAEPAPPSAPPPVAAAPAADPPQDEPPPDWLRLRRAWKDDGGAV